MARHGFGASAASGFVVLAATCFLVAAVVETSSGSAAGEILQARFSSIDGLKPGARVTIAGVTVGEVVYARLDSKSFMSDVRFSVGRRLPIPADSIAEITGGGFAGGAALRIDPGKSSTYLRSGDAVSQTASPESLETQVGHYIFGNGGLPQ